MVAQSSVQLHSPDDDGVAGFEYTGVGGSPFASWAPDDKKLAVLKLNLKNTTRLPIVQWLPKTQVKHVHQRTARDAIKAEIHIIDVGSKQSVNVDADVEPRFAVDLRPG